jgi:hypothetical protein
VLATSYARDLADMLAVAGTEIEINQVLAAISRAKVGPVRGSHASEENDDAVPHAQKHTESYDPAEVEVLAFMIANPLSRLPMTSIISEDMFNSPSLQAAYQKLAQDGHKGDAHELLSDIVKSNPALSTVFSGFDFEAATQASQEVGIELSRIHASRYWKREVRTLKAQLRKENDTETKKRLMEKIMTLQQRIIELDT